MALRRLAHDAEADEWLRKAEAAIRAESSRSSSRPIADWRGKAELDILSGEAKGPRAPEAR
jgi:hypothetical protein